jgi:subtilase family serine protease
MTSGLTGAGQTIAIVDAPGSGNIANDLNTFSAYYGLPKCGATGGSSCSFTKVDLSNGAAVSSRNDWATEIALDVEWAHAVAPAANIVLVIAKSSSMQDMFSAVNTAATISGVKVVSMSWGAPEFFGEATYDAVFAKYPSTVFFASAGDSGNNGSNQIYPAASPNVTAVGGTSIKSLAASASAVTEAAWTYGGGGASIYEPMPAYQASYLAANNPTIDALNKGKRAIPDIAYNADPNSSPVGVYVNGGWWAVGGTSAGAPQWAGITAQLGQHFGGQLPLQALVNGGFNGRLYALARDFVDITSGSNKTGRAICVLCNATAGFDDVTGLGVPNFLNLVANY